VLEWRVSVPLENAVVAVCNLVSDAEAVVSELRQQGLEPGCISIVAVDERSGSTPIAYFFEQGCLSRTAARGGCWRVLEALSECAVLVCPGERTAILAGPFAASVVRTLDNEGLFGDLGPIASGLYSLGISKDAARDYELTALQGHALVIVQGRAQDVARARRVLTDRLQGNATVEVMEMGLAES
jgi:hypothetical protein